jgi:hypothetical protein
MAFNIEDLHFVHVGNSSFIADYSDYSTGNPATDILSLENYNDAYFLVIKGAGAVGTATITMESCDTVVPGTATAVGFEYKVITSGDTDSAWTTVASTGYLITAAADKMILVHVSAAGLYSTNKFLRMQLTETDSTACKGAVVAFLANPRYSPYAESALA